MSGSASPVVAAYGGPTPNIAGVSPPPSPPDSLCALEKISNHNCHKIHNETNEEPCGAHRIWKWRNQYGEVLGGLGTGIGDADRGVECARGKHCLGGKYIEHETDCDADDAREAEDLAAGTSSRGSTLSLYSGSHSWSSSSSHSSLHGASHSNASNPVGGGLLDLGSGAGASRTPSPAVGPGYARHEVEGIGNKIKTVKVSMIRVGKGVPEWKDEKATGQSLRREISGEVRSWCGWCARVIPGEKDYATDGTQRPS